MFYIKISFFGRNRSRGKMVRLRNTATLFYSTVPLLFSTVYQYLVRFFTRLDHPFSVYCHSGLVKAFIFRKNCPGTRRMCSTRRLAASTTTTGNRWRCRRYTAIPVASLHHCLEHFWTKESPPRLGLLPPPAALARRE